MFENLLTSTPVKVRSVQALLPRNVLAAEKRKPSLQLNSLAVAWTPTCSAGSRPGIADYSLEVVDLSHHKLRYIPLPPWVSCFLVPNTSPTLCSVDLCFFSTVLAAPWRLSSCASDSRVWIQTVFFPPVLSRRFAMSISFRPAPSCGIVLRSALCSPQSNEKIRYFAAWVHHLKGLSSKFLELLPHELILVMQSGFPWAWGSFVWIHNLTRRAWDQDIFQQHSVTNIVRI